MKVLMVCLGNICRSPLADGLLRKKILQKGLNVYVDSAGTSNYHVGQSPDSRMRETAHRFGLSIDELRARQFKVEDFDEFDLIYAMDDSNYNDMIKLARNNADVNKVKLILNEPHPNKNLNVPDPYFGGDEGFTIVYNLLDEATNCIIQNLSTQ